MGTILMLPSNVSFEDAGNNVTFIGEEREFDFRIQPDWEMFDRDQCTKALAQLQFEVQEIHARVNHLKEARRDLEERSKELKRKINSAEEAGRHRARYRAECQARLTRIGAEIKAKNIAASRSDEERFIEVARKFLSREDYESIWRLVKANDGGEV